MYAPLLTNRYLTSRVIPLIAVAAVALCVALVIVVMSVMTGFLDMLLSSGRKLMGDVIITYPVNGIPHYERLLADISELPEAEAATPLISTFGLIRMPYPDDARKELVTAQVWCIEPESFGKVVEYESSLYWGPHHTIDKDFHGGPVRPQRAWGAMLEEGRTLHDSQGRPGLVMGMHVSAINRRTEQAEYKPVAGRWFMPNHEVSLILAPTSITQSAEREAEQLKEVVLPVLNEMFTGVFQVDKQRVMIPLAEGQRLLWMGKGATTDPDLLDEDGLPVVRQEEPARVTMILVRAKEGVTPDQLRDRVEAVYDAFARESFKRAVTSQPPHPDVVLPPDSSMITIRTWQEQLADLIGPVMKERELMRTLFSIVNVVCAALVLSIFWAIVYEKTRDIGILRSIGASRYGIVWIFLRYGLVVGVVGALTGAALAWLVVRRINDIQTALAKPPLWLIVGLFAVAGLVLVQVVWSVFRSRFLPVVVGAMGCIILLLVASLVLWLRLQGGFIVWDPSVYYFNSIPNEVDWFSAIFTMIGAVLFSLIGAVVPAAKAADTDPVQALRYE
jgi:lipoprotein-releasing system permease protein